VKADISPLILVAFVGVALFMLLRIRRFGGFRAAMFGAQIQRTVGEATGTGGSLVSTRLRVHVLADPPEKAVGLEFVSKSFASYQMRPITLSVAEAQNLIALLQAATSGT
jgi:hypothetical protein